MRCKLTTINLDYLYKTKEKKTWRAVGILEKAANYGFPKKNLDTKSKRKIKTFPENWDSKAPSVGTLFTYLENKTFCFSR
jgi:hypothetical protein